MRRKKRKVANRISYNRVIDVIFIESKIYK